MPQIMTTSVVIYMKKRFYNNCHVLKICIARSEGPTFVCSCGRNQKSNLKSPLNLRYCLINYNLHEQKSAEINVEIRNHTRNQDMSYIVSEVLGSSIRS